MQSIAQAILSAMITKSQFTLLNSTLADLQSDYLRLKSDP